MPAIAGIFLLATPFLLGQALASGKAEAVPLRVILCIDASGSMCENYGPGRCCTAGDSSGFCSRNDPTNMRIEASHRFIDSLRAYVSASEVGVVQFLGTRISSLPPLPLVVNENLLKLDTAIDNAACAVSAGVAKTGKTDKVAVTYIGAALELAFTLADTTYGQSPFQRHVILLTDGAWEDGPTRSPDSLLIKYKSTFPGRNVPVVHVFYIADSATHVQHGYPAQGCADDAPVDRAPLHTIASLTGGTFHGGVTPQTIVADILSALSQITAVGHRIGGTPQGKQFISGASSKFSGIWYDLQGRKMALGGRGSEMAGNGARPGIYLGSMAGTQGNLKPFLMMRP
jgi:hypothetical protein